jgi:hypothetical protein
LDKEMTLLSQNISEVRAFALSGGIKNAAAVRWRSVYNDKLYQVYVNGKFAGATVGINQRQIVVPMPVSVKTAARIAVFAVEPEFADIDFSDELASNDILSGRVRIEFPKTDNLPIGGKADFYYDGYKQNERSILLQSFAADKGGFGLSCFGRSDFGFDGSAAVGFGKGNFGQGQFGFDAETLRWQSGQLGKGNYKFTVNIIDSAGNTMQEAGQSQTITVIPPAKPAEKLVIESFDKTNGKLILKVE